MKQSTFNIKGGIRTLLAIMALYMSIDRVMGQGTFVSYQCPMISCDVSISPLSASQIAA